MQANAKPAQGRSGGKIGENWHELTAIQALDTLQTEAGGLTEAEAHRRLERFGANTIERVRGDGPLKILWGQINNPLLWVLIVSGVLAIALGKATDGLVVLAVVVLNAIIGFVQEYRAGKAIEALGHMVPEEVSVLRAGQKITLASAKLVPGDVVLLASGDKVPADLRLTALKNLQVEEAALTGESLPVAKDPAALEKKTQLGDRLCMAYGGTLVTYGTATGVVVATGTETELGRISNMLRETTSLETPLTRALALMARYLTIGILVFSAVFLAIGLLRSIGQGMEVFEALKETLVFAIALAVGAIPEGLPAIVTIALAIGVQRMAARRAIIRKLPAVETLGSTTVICTDKTGTLTRNEMTLRQIVVGSKSYEITGAGYEPTGEFLLGGAKLAGLDPEPRVLLRDAVLCSDATAYCEQGVWKISGDPTEGALIVAALKAGIDADSLRISTRRLDVLPFESENQFMAVLYSEAQGSRLVIKGAPEVVLRRCRGGTGHDGSLAMAQSQKVNELAARGMRVLAVAAKNFKEAKQEIGEADLSGGLELLGLVGMIDPPRPEAIDAIRRCQQAGITVKMITGDHRVTAREIAKQLGLMTEGQEVVSGSELADMSESELNYAASSTNVFARVAPEHKLLLVKSLQSQGQVVAMTGDGVNDAPALKQSNIGVAMGITGTAVSRESADIVLTDDNFASIVAAVEEGRRVFDNLVKSMAFLLPTNVGLALIMMCALVFFPFDPVSGDLLLPMRPTQLLWINLVAAVALALPLAFEAKEPDLMSRPPRSPDASLMNRLVLWRTFYAALLMCLGSVGLFYWAFHAALAAQVSEPIALSRAQTMSTSTVILFQIFYMLQCRSLRGALREVGWFSNPTVYIGIGVVLVLHAAFIYLPFMQVVFNTQPLTAMEVLWTVLAAIIIVPVVVLEKIALRRV